MKRNMKTVLLSFLSILLGACNTMPQRAMIEKIPEKNLLFQHVMYKGVHSFIGREVRWGGKIISVNNDDNHSVIEIRQLPLTEYGFPLQNTPSGGVFFSQSDQNYDPELYQRGLLITFLGTIDSQQTMLLNGKEQNVPVIDIQQLRLWPHSNTKQGAHTYTGSESRFHGYGYYGSGHYRVY